MLNPNLAWPIEWEAWLQHTHECKGIKKSTCSCLSCFPDGTAFLLDLQIVVTQTTVPSRLFLKNEQNESVAQGKQLTVFATGDKIQTFKWKWGPESSSLPPGSQLVRDTLGSLHIFKDFAYDNIWKICVIQETSIFQMTNALCYKIIPR